MRLRSFVSARLRRVGIAPVLALALMGTQGLAGGSTGFTVPALAAANKAQPNRFDPKSAAASVLHRPQVASHATNPTKSAPDPHDQVRPIAVPMQPGRVPVDPVNGAHFLGSDGALEFDVPADAVTAADVSSAGGSMSLLVRQVLPPSGSSAGGSGHFSLGTFLIQLLDGSGKPAKQGLRKPGTFKLHHDQRAQALDMRHAGLLINPSMPAWFDTNPPATLPALGSPSSASGTLSPASNPPPLLPSASLGTSAAAPTTSAVTGTAPLKLGPMSHQATTLDAANSTLSSVAPLISATTGVSFDTDSPVATFGKPDPFEVGLSGGALTARYPIDVPAGPGGLTPPVSLAYDSAAVSGQHNPQGAAPWVGEGWNLSFGSISWAEHQVQSLCTNLPTPPCTNPAQWEDSWQLSDPFGTGADLVPPDINVSTYNDDTGQGITPSPITWHTAPQTRDKVISFNGSITLPGSATPAPCFRVWLPSGVMEEFGCTGDSLQWYPQPTGVNSGKAYIANWLLDLITDPSGNQIHVTYQQDMEPGAGGLTYPRDAVPATVEWDSPGCLNAQAACTGGGWAPLMRVNFAAAHSIAHVNGSSCAANGNLRCDDSVDLSGSGGVAAPTIQSTLVLNDAQVQVRSSGAAAWNTLRDYRMSYDQSGPTTITDPISGTPQSTAGKLNLTQLQEIGSDGVTLKPASVFQYTQVTSYYEDSLTLPNPTTNCGPSWNTGRGKGCVLWSQSYAGNNSYLSSVSNGLGLAQTYGWQLARNNFHGVNAGGANTSNPFYCNDASVASTFPCNVPDDESWSRVVLTQKTNALIRPSQAGSTNVTGTTTYNYQVPYPIPAPQCATCQATFYWGNINDDDYLDFYNYRFTGFAQTTASLPDGSVQVHKFFPTEGTGGLYDISQISCQGGGCHNAPFWDTPNAAHGHEYELDEYDTDGTSLLSQVRTRWAATCPPIGVGGTPFNATYGSWGGNLVTELDHSNPVGVCEIRPSEVDRYTFDGSGGASSHSASAYAYDGLGRISSEAQIADTGRTAVADSSGFGNQATWSGGVTEGVPGLAGDADTAMSFDGTSGYVAAPALTPLQGDNNRSVELWFSTPKTGSYTGQQNILDAGSSGVTGQAFSIGVTELNGVGGNSARAPGIFIGFWSDDVFLPNIGVRDGKPHHLVLTLTGTSVFVYVDGSTPQGQVWNGTSWTGMVGQPFTLPSVPNTPATPLWIGRTRANIWGAPGSYFDGLVDEVAVYDHVLASARVQAHLTAGSGYQQAVMADTPTAYYRLDDGGPSVNPSTILRKPQYVWNDSVAATATSASGTYIINRQTFDDVEDLAGNRYSCGYASYDGQNFAMGQSGSLTRGLATTADRYTSCGTQANSFFPSGQIRTTHTYDAFGNQLTTSDPDANAGNSAHQGCTVGTATYSTCTTYDGTFDVLPTASANALNQASHNGYQAPSSGTPTDGFGLWPISKTDANGQTATRTYDPLGRPISETLPGEGGGLTTTGMVYTVWCSGTSPQSPCVEVDKTQRLNSTTTVTYRAFYDGLGHLVETRSPAPNGQDIVRYSYYDPSQRLIFQSVAYFVTAYTGSPGSAAFSIPDTSQAGTSHTYDGLGRQTSTTDALSNKTTTARSAVCGPAGTGDSACYEQILTTDPKGHRTGRLVDPLGRTTYEQRYTGNTSASYAVYATSKYSYDFVGNLTHILHPDGSTQSSFQYDMAGRKTGMTDPDRGGETYNYDQNGNPVQSVDARAGAGTIFMGYDGLNRPIWRNTSNSPTGAYDSYTYDNTAGGNLGVGRLTGESFAGSAGSQLSGSYAYAYDGRGRQTGSTLTVGFGSGLGAPTGLTAVAGNAQGTVSWTAPASDGGTAITGYTVTASPGGLVASVNGSTTTATVNGLTNGTAYSFTVTASTAMGAGPSSAASNSVVPATVPGAPTGVTAVAATSQATVSWTAPVSNGGSAVTGYTVTASPGGAKVSVNGTATSAVLGGLSNGTAYTFAVTAANAMGPGAASAASNSVTPQSAPGTVVVDQRIGLQHGGPLSTLTSAPFAVKPKAGDLIAVPIWGYNLTVSSVTDSAGNAYVRGAQSALFFGMRVEIWYAKNVVVPSGSWTVTVNTSPAAADLEFDVVALSGANQTAPLDAAATASGGDPTAAKSGSVSVASTQAGDYFVGAMSTNSASSNVNLTTASPWVQRDIDPNNVADQAGQVADLATSPPAGSQTWSFSWTTPADTWVAGSVAFKAASTGAAPGAPGGVTATPSNGQAQVSWTAPTGSSVTGYTVTASPGGQTATVGGSTTTATVNGLSNGTAYTFAVTATNSAGTGPASVASNSVTPATVPGAPTALTAVAGNSQAAVSWTAPSSNGGAAIAGYTVTASPGGKTATVSGGTPSATVGGLTNGTAYSFTVTASNSVGAGAASAASNSVAPAAPPVYQVQTSYDDADNVLTQTYPTGETVTNSYTAQGWLSGVTTTRGSTTTILASNLTYTGSGGALGEMTAMHLGGGYDFSASFDVLGRASDLKVKRSSDGSTLFDQARTFDAAGNVASASTTLPGGTDNQVFCYDEQDRLTWAGSAGTPPCTGTAIPAGSLSAAQYSQSFSYDSMGRLANGPLGTYSYADPAHVHAATATSTGYTARYDAAGSMTCRAPTTSSSCSGTPTGAQLSYNNEGELSGWQNAPTSPSSSASFLYDGHGERVLQQTTSAGVTSTTVYLGDLEEVTSSGSTTTTTTYYYANGKRIALAVNGTISYLASDALGSSTVTLNGSGAATASQLFAPYGRVRYSSGSMATSFSFTGQRADTATGLDYFHARYLDPLLGQFASADTVLADGGFDILGLSRYAYVKGNPIGRTDPKGHDACIDDGMGGCVFPDPTPPDPCANGGCDPGPPPNPCEGSSNCGGGDPGTGPGDPCGGQCGGPELGQPPDPDPASPTPAASPADRCGGCTDSNQTNPSSSPRAGDVFTFLGHDIGPVVDVIPTGTGLGGLLAGNLDAVQWNVESAVSAVLLTPYESAYAINVHHPGNAWEGALSWVQHVSLGWDIGFDRFEQRTHYPGANVRDEGTVVNWFPSIFTIVRVGGRTYVVKVTYGPKSGGPTPGVEPNGKEDYAP